MPNISRPLKRLLILAAWAVLLLPLHRAFASDENPCLKHESHQSLTFFLVDRSDKLADLQGLKQTLAAVKEMIQPGERLMVGVSAGKLSETRVILDVVRPASSVWESVMKTRAREKMFEKCFTQMEDAVLKQDEAHKTSALLETLSFVDSNVNSDQSKARRVVIFSDMMQNSDSLSFYSMKAVDPSAAMQKVEKESWQIHLPATEVFVSGAGVGVPDEKARQIEEFWRKYFDKAGAQLKFYGPVFVGV
jgi:hypothetical protein